MSCLNRHTLIMVLLSFVVGSLFAQSPYDHASQSMALQIPAESPAMPRITILYDAFGKHVSMKKDWGFSALIEMNGKRILFDTGNNPDIFEQNVNVAGVDLTKLDFVVISHRHGDHVGGLTYLLKLNPTVTIYAPRDGLGGIFGSSLPGSFFRKTDLLPTEMRYFDGNPPAVMNLGNAWPGASFKLIDKTTEVMPGITLTVVVSDITGTKEMKELSLAIHTPEGIVLIVGCSHPGIEAIVAEAAKIETHIHFIAGGFHLVTTPDSTIARIAGSLKDKWKVDYIAPGHCTGEPAFLALKQAFGEHYIYAGLGTVLDPATLMAR